MKKHTVLIVDDEEMVLKAMLRALRQEDYKIITAQSGEQGLALLEAHEVSLVVSDYNMPGMDGLAFLKEVKKASPQALTVMLTGVGDIEVAMHAINEVGVYKFILKPWDDADFKVTIRRALESLELVMQRDSLLEQVKTRDALLQELEREHPGITRVERDDDGYIISDY